MFIEILKVRDSNVIFSRIFWFDYKRHSTLNLEDDQDKAIVMNVDGRK